MNIAVGADHAGLLLKQALAQTATKLGHHVIDVGCTCTTSVDYPDYAELVAAQIISKQAERGILVCGTGIGMSISANKIPGIRCAVIHDLFSAKITREHNDTNVLAMGARIIGVDMATEIVRIWIETTFSHGERHKNRLDKITVLEHKYRLQR